MRNLLFFLVLSLPCFGAEEFLKLGKSQGLTFHANHPLTEKNETIEAIVVVVHGILRNAKDYFDWTVESAEKEGAAGRTLILAPHFKNEGDKAEVNELFWLEGDWKTGANALTYPDTLSSFTVVDGALAELPKYFPNLKRITVTGHSAGGQFTSRYSAGTQMPERLPSFEWRFVIANPSSFLFLNEERPRPVVDCKGFNEYPYGLEKPNMYFSGVSAERARENVRSRDITIFQGENDTETELLDQSCEAMAEGKNRFERGTLYFDYLVGFLNPKKLQRVVVPGVGHDGKLMYQSSEGQRLLFL